MREKMASSEKRKLICTRDQARDPFAGLTDEQRIKLPPTSSQTDDDYLTGTSFKSSAGQSQAEDSAMSPLSSRPADLEGDNAIAFYPSGAQPSESDRPTLVDAVIEQLRQARLRRQRPH
jgi:hypothetical protein